MRQVTSKAIAPCRNKVKPTTLKDWPKVYEQIKHIRGLDEHEKIQFARSMAATPDERWQMNVSFLRSLGLWGHSKPGKSGSN